MGVAPQPSYGAISSIEPSEHGGNLDCKELMAGSALHLPVWMPGAPFSAGDGHGLQGDREVCVSALETNLEGRLIFLLHKNTGLRFPRAETPTQRHAAQGPAVLTPTCGRGRSLSR